MPKADEDVDPPPATPGADRRRTVAACFDVARRRPLAGRDDDSTGQAEGRSGRRPTEDTRRRLEWLGRERELIDKTLVLTGLRKGELASLTVGQLVLDADPAFLALDAADEKNREGSTIRLRMTLPTCANGSPTRQRPHSAKLKPCRARSTAADFRAALPPDTLVFTVRHDC